MNKNLFFITYLLAFVGTARATEMPTIGPKKNPATISYCAKWSQEIQKSLDPLWIPEPVRHLITEYSISFTWKRMSKTSIPSSTACAYIPTSKRGPLLAIGNAETYNIQFFKVYGDYKLANLKGHNRGVRQLIYSQINHMLISRAYNEIRLWNVNTNHVKKSSHLKTLPWVCKTVALSPHEDVFAAAISTCDISLLKIIPLLTDEQPREYSFPRYEIEAIGWHHDNKRLLIHGSSFSESGTKTIIFDTPTGTTLRSFTYKEPEPQRIVYLSHLNQIYYFIQRSSLRSFASDYNSDLSIVSDNSGEKIKSMQLPHRPHTQKIIQSPHDAFVSLISEYSKLAIVDTLTHTIETLPVRFSKTWDPVFFASDDCIIVPGRDSGISTDFDEINVIRYVPDEE